MPTYSFRNKLTEETWTEFMSMSAHEELIKDLNIEQLVSAPAIISGTSAKPDSGFRDVLKKIKSSHYRSSIDTY